MSMRLGPKSASSLFPTDILFQTRFWSGVKARLGWKPIAFDFTTPKGTYDVLVLTRHLSYGAWAAYVPQGPEFAPPSEEYGPFLEKLSEAIAGYLDPCIAFIRYDLPWESPYAAEAPPSDGLEWAGHPESRVREMRMNYGTDRWNLRKAILDLTVADTLILDISKTEEDILKAMKPKTRYNIHLASRKGVRALNASEEMLPEFYRLYEMTAARHGFSPSSYDHFAALFPRHGSSEIHFLLAIHERKALAGAIVGISGQMATYLFGASESDNRNLMGSYAVQWAAIRLARARGCLAYDMGAVPPRPDRGHPFYGLYRFKTGFGGRMIHRNGTWDYPLDTDAYRAFRNSETIAAANQPSISV